MAVSNARIREVIERYVALVASGTADEIVALFAEGATLEDPVGSEVRTTRESIREFYGSIEGLEQEGRILTSRVAGASAAFHFELSTKAGDQTFHLAPIDVMTFDDDALITSMKAYWSNSDMSVS